MEKNILHKNNAKNLILGKSLSKFGDVLFDYANSVWLVNMNRNNSKLLAIYQSSEVLVAVLLNLIGGVISDSSNRKKILFKIDIISGILCILISFLNNRYLMFGLLLLNIIFAVLSAFKSPTYKSIFKEIFIKERIGNVNSLYEAISESIRVLGPLLSLIILSEIGLKESLLVNGCSFFLSAYFINKLVRLENVQYKKDKKNFYFFIREIKSGFNYLYQNKIILYLIILSCFVNFTLAGYNLFLPYSVEMYSSLGESVYAKFLTISSIGGIMGSYCNTKIKQKYNLKRMINTLGLCGVFLTFSSFFYYLIPNILGIGSMILLFNFFLSIYNIQFMTYIQTNVDEIYIGKVFSIVFSVAILLMPIGTMTFSRIMKTNSTYNFSIFGVLIIISVILFLIILHINLKGENQ